MNPFKFPISESVCGSDMCVIHPPISNPAITSPPDNHGLQPNGLSLDTLQANHEFIKRGDMLDKAAIASKVSSSMAKETMNTISALKKLSKAVVKH